MKSLKLKQNTQGLRVHCSKCKRNFNHDKLKNCKHGSSQTYKTIVYLKGKTPTKNHETKSFEEALLESIRFRKKVKTDSIHISTEKIDNKNKFNPETGNIVVAADLYLMYKHNEGDDVAIQEMKELTPDYLNTIQRNIQLFINVTAKKIQNFKNKPLCNLTKFDIKYWYLHVQNSYKETSWASHKKALKYFINYMIEFHSLKMTNPFNTVKWPSKSGERKAITKTEFDAVIDSINNKSSTRQLGGVRKETKSYYRDYLKDGIRLSLFTGLRIGEIVKLRWSDLQYFNNQLILVCRNDKVETLKKETVRPKVVPVGEQLHELLNNLGFENNKDSEKYILFPKRGINNTTLANNISKGFSHFYKMAFPYERVKELTCLRITYISYLKIKAGKDTIQLTSHANDKTLKKFYLDRRVVAKGAEIKIFDESS